MHLFEKPQGVKTRWFSPENPNGLPGQGGLENLGAKGRPYIKVPAGESVCLFDLDESGIVCRMWMTISDRSPQMLRGLRLEMFWDGAEEPAVSVPFGDFFGVGLGRTTEFECALFSNPEGRSFNCFVPMPFWKGARIVVTNESGSDLGHLFYDIDVLTGVEHSPETLYFHACWRREAPNALGREFTILPPVSGNGRFLGCNLGVITDAAYAGSWWGEGEVKIRFGGESGVTLCGTGTEDYIGTGWGQSRYINRTQGCSIADKERRHYAFYRYHLDDPVFFDGGCEVSIQTIGGSGKPHVMEMLAAGASLTPVTLDSPSHGTIQLMPMSQPVNLVAVGAADAWCNFWRQDDWSSVAYFYLDSPASGLPGIGSAQERMVGLSEK